MFSVSFFALLTCLHYKNFFLWPLAGAALSGFAFFSSMTTEDTVSAVWRKQNGSWLSLLSFFKDYGWRRTTLNALSSGRQWLSGWSDRFVHGFKRSTVRCYAALCVMSLSCLLCCCPLINQDVCEWDCWMSSKLAENIDPAWCSYKHESVLLPKA